MGVGIEFWNHVVMDVSHTGYAEQTKEDQEQVKEDIEQWINDVFKESVGAPLDTVFLDVEEINHLRFKENVEQLWELVSQMKRFCWKDVSAARSESAELQSELNKRDREIPVLRSENSASQDVCIRLEADSVGGKWPGLVTVVPGVFFHGNLCQQVCGCR